ncbi:metallophosphoesterase family protein [Staphylococcus massiliensis]|uniref:Icc family phosphohydrolase n=1 Tax=Staphylococcus massiliensis S46 TaxID=1229783 RepID=K9AUV8_9STAP|nr:metallophosphoesterase family protein [Staphylococcus massiliensis]EKU46342.1 Icc family phosphohydrolase [Staphylococcus massiliensis S46]MCG3398677.1 metallophosphoesterase family protein [Staphylococcus massiliensis]MCG3401239.1 metallophosphoesterase family protein [Staphylococcus massiliensis]MCG3412584.1 metallophosphoesterase family protein [Staphylococcus massiliensis]POA01180.1 phosphohydrolase [Staphylococcus massiliensis CCUG 55927]
MDNFKIIQLADLHLSPHHDDKDQQTYTLIDHMIRYYQPDLIIMTGDQIWSEGIVHSDETYKRLVEYINQYDVKVATTFGNHDTEGRFSRGDIREIEKGFQNYVEKKHSLIVDDKEAYTIEIEMDGELSHVIYIIDGGDYCPHHIGEYSYIHPQHVNWMRELRETVYKDVAHHNLMFTHIALQEYEAIRDVEHEDFRGIFEDELGYAKLNSGMFTQLLINGDVEGVFVGHDHCNDFMIDYHGIKLGYGRISGYNAYGDLNRGAREITLRKDKPFETKVLEFDGAL